MKKIITVSALILMTGCASTGSVKNVNEDSGERKPCVKNFTHEGNMVLGSTFKTNALIENVSKKSAFEKVSKYVAMDGWHITYSDEDLGIISGSQTVSFGEGKSAPLNILINAKGQDSDISISFSTSMGVYSPSESVMNNFCKMVNSVAN